MFIYYIFNQKVVICLNSIALLVVNMYTAHFEIECDSTEYLTWPVFSINAKTVL